MLSSSAELCIEPQTHATTEHSTKAFFWARCKLPNCESRYAQFALSGTTVAHVKARFLSFVFCKVDEGKEQEQEEKDDEEDEDDYLLLLRGGPVLMDDAVPFADPPAHEIIADALRRGAAVGLRLISKEDPPPDPVEKLSPSVRRLILPFSFPEWQRVLEAHKKQEENEIKRAAHEAEKARAEWRRQLEEAKQRREQADKAVHDRAEEEKRKKRDEMERKREALLERKRHLQAQRAAMSPERVPSGLRPVAEPSTPTTTPLRRSQDSRKDIKITATQHKRNPSTSGNPTAVGNNHRNSNSSSAAPTRTSSSEKIPVMEEEILMIDEDEEVLKVQPLTEKITVTVRPQKKSGSHIGANSISNNTSSTTSNESAVANPAAARLANNRTVSSNAISAQLVRKSSDPLTLSRHLMHSNSGPAIPGAPAAVLDVFEDDITKMLQFEEKQKLRAKARKVHQRHVSKHPPGRTVQLRIVASGSANANATSASSSNSINTITVAIPKNTIEDFHLAIRSAANVSDKKTEIAALYEETGEVPILDDDDTSLIPPGSVVRVIFVTK